MIALDVGKTMYDPVNINNLVVQIQEIVRQATNIVFFTGAGISKESGIPTFRDKDGLWNKYDPTKLASLTAFKSDPRLVWDFFYSRQRLICDAKFNEAHITIASVEKSKLDNCWVLTQNIDSLHQRAGSSNVIELHGNIFGLVCLYCGTVKQYNHETFFKEFDGKDVPLCERCDKILKPNVVLFEEPLPTLAWQQAIQLSSDCDVMFVVGSSLSVSPANMLPYYAMKGNATVIEINPNKSEMSHLMDFSVRASANNVLPKIFGMDSHSDKML
ncbi:SIR2 family NAD-dependent protein deacylase [Candidatus Nitrosocosmicus franklandus]|uniref:NAD-dependent protein deacylase n=1 Tax=Candidatus Nitrosocosmicus franklandianus TaxID=1798806 RepID=A0A484I6Z8_9ARCH|nr:NAD-dependent deacylase [Candidatus Nitrosocosmicus franklandus]VFJ12951.1 NAD-dependent protein deacylase [Candidatus Nitrosocosmicus franklandus]